jgi:basic membrane protein A and related proteins
MTRISRLAGALAVAVALMVTPAAARGLSSHHAAAKQLSVGVVLDVGGVNDKSFNHLAYVGLQTVESKYHVNGSYIATQEQAQYVPNITHYALLHPSLIIAVGGLMTQAMYIVARQYPHQKFALIDGAPADANFVTHNLPNVANLIFHEQEAGFLVGVLAGLMEKNHVGAATHNTIGAMGGLPVPAVIRYIAGYAYGAKLVDPGVKIKLSYSQSFTNQGTGNSIGRTQISSGADILFQVAGASGLGYLRAAQQAGRYGIGVDANQGYLGSYVITSALKRVDLAVERTVVALATGKFRAGNHFFTINNGAIGYGKPAAVVPASIVAQVNAYEAKVKSGAIVPPTKIHL